MTSVVLAEASYRVFIMEDSYNGHELGYAMDGTFLKTAAWIFPFVLCNLS